MSDEKPIKKVLTLAGIFAAISIPIFFLFKKKKTEEDISDEDYDADIFSRELK